MTNRVTDSQFGRKFLASRLSRRHSQATIARRAGITPSYLSRIERGKINPSLEMALRLAEAVRMPLGEILGAGKSEGRSGACPVSGTGQCLIDLIDTSGRPALTRETECYSPRQLRLLRRFAALLQQVDEDLMAVFEILIRKNLKQEPGDVQDE